MPLRIITNGLDMITMALPQSFRYEKVTSKGFEDASASTRIIRILMEDDRFLTGDVVNKEGDKLDKVWLIDKTTITKRVPMVMNNHYGELEPV